MPNQPKSLATRGGFLAELEGKTMVEKVNHFLSLAPTVEDDPTEVMLQKVLESPDPRFWKDIFDAESVRERKGEEFRINAYRVRPSDFKGSLKHYMVLDVTDLNTGERGVLTCSSLMSIAQVINAEARVNLPIDVRIVEKDRDTKNGFRPIHLEYIGKSEAPLGDPNAVVSEQ